MMTSSPITTPKKRRTASVLTMYNYRKWSRLAGFTALTVALNACQSIPAMQTDPSVARPNIPLGSGEGFEVYGDQQVPSSFASVRWQTFYTDPKLKTLIQLGLNNNKDIKQTILAIQKARAQYRITDNNDLPTVNANGDYTRASQGGYDNANNSYNVNLGMANYELDFWGRIASLKDQALQNYLSTAAAKDTAQVSLISNIAKSYVNLSYQLKQFELATKTLDTRLESLRITQARLDAGIDSKAPSLQASASAETARIAALNAQSAVLKAKNALRYLIGAPITDDLMPEPAIASITGDQVLSAGLPSELLRYRPDVLQAEYQLKAAGANIEVARAAYYPSISLTGRLGYSSNDLSDLFKSSAAGWSFGPSVSIPIFDAGQRDANYEVAEIEREQALANYESTIETAFREVSDVLAERATLEARTAAQYRLQENYNEIFDISEARFIAQVDDYLSVLDAQRSLFSTQQSILNLELERLTNQIELYQVLGGGANLVDPVNIPVAKHRNLTHILAPKSDEQVATEAIVAASSPAIVSQDQANAIESDKPLTVIEQTILDPVDIDNDDQADALMSEVKTFTVPADSLADTQIVQTEKGAPVVTPSDSKQAEASHP